MYDTPYYLFFIVKSNTVTETQELTHEYACTARQCKGVLSHTKEKNQ